MCFWKREWPTVYVLLCQMRYSVIRRNMQQSDSVNQKSCLAHAQGRIFHTCQRCYGQVSWLEQVQINPVCSHAPWQIKWILWVEPWKMHPQNNSFPERCDMHHKTGWLLGKVNSATYPQIMYRREEGQGSSVSFSSLSQVLSVRSKSCVATKYLVITQLDENSQLGLIKAKEKRFVCIYKWCE